MTKFSPIIVQEIVEGIVAASRRGILRESVAGDDGSNKTNCSSRIIACNLSPASECIT